MPDFIVTSPDGQKFKITAPPGATQAQVLDYAQKNFSSARSSSPAPQAPSKTPDYTGGADLPRDQQIQNFLSNTGPDAGKLPPESTTPQEQSARDAGGPTKPEDYWKQAAEGTHPSPPYQKQGETLPGGRQELYDMATNDVERFKILSKYYGKDNVGRDQYGMYVKLPNGRQMYPRSSVLSSVASQAAPIAGQIGGAIAGGAAGGPAAAIGGAAVGGAAGQGVNDYILSRFRFYDRTMGQEAGTLATAALEGAVPEGAGIGARSVMRAGGALMAGTGLTGAKLAGTGQREALRYLIGFDAEAAARAKSLVERGYKVNPVGYAKDMRRLAFHFEIARKTGGDPIANSEAKLIKDEITSNLRATGMSADQASSEFDRMKTIAESSVRPAGEALQQAAGKEAATDADAYAAQRAKIVAERETAMKAAIPPPAEVAKTQARANTLERMVQKTLDQGNRQLQVMAYKVKPGPLSQDYANKVVQYRNAIQESASQLYKAADEISGGATHDFSGAQLAAQDFIHNLPADLRGNFPEMVRRIEQIGGEDGTEARMTFGQAHYLRSQLRDLAYSDKLTPDFKKGAYKHLSNVVDQIIHQGEAAPEWKSAVTQLDKADKYYAKNMKQFNDAMLQRVVSNINAGLPPDPIKLARTIGQEGHMAAFDRILKIGGEPLRQRVAAADMQDLLKASKRLGEDTIDPKELLRELTDRANNRTLNRIYGAREGQQMMTYARQLAARNGIIPPGALNQTMLVEGRPGRTIKNLLDAQKSIDTMAKADPTALMDAASKPYDQRIAALESRFKTRFSNDVMGFLHDPKVLAEAAANKVLNSSELLEHAAERFPESVPMLRQVATERILAPLVRGGGPEALESSLSKISPRAQQILFPDGMDKSLQHLVSDLRVIRGNPTGAMSSMSAGGILSQPPITEKGLSHGFIQQEFAIYLSKLMASRRLNKMAIDFLIKDVESGPEGLIKAKTKLESLLSGMQSVGKRIPLRAVGRRSGFEENEGTPEGREKLPAMDEVQ